MKLNLQKFALVVAALLILAVPAFAQHYPEPVKSNQSPAICTGCIGNNAFGKPNDKLKTFSFSDPLVKHVGRAVDSTTTDDYQDRGGGTGFRTARAGKMLVAKTQRGAAPPRVYLQLGSAIGAYSLDKFFSTTLPAGPVAVSTLIPWGRADRNPSETVAKWDAFLYPEAADSGWTTPLYDGQDRLFDFDVDDRGLLYAATGGFGWGIVKDTGSTGHMPLVKQMLAPTDTSGVTPAVIVSIKVEGRYYAVTSNSTDASTGRAAFDVGNASSPMFHRKAVGPANSIVAWAKDDAAQRVAIVNGESKILIFDYAAFVNAGAPLATFTARSGMSYQDVTVDENGNFWAGENTTKNPGPATLVRFSPTGSTYTSDSFSGGSGSLAIRKIHFSDKYLIAIGLGTQYGGFALELRLYRMENDKPVAVDLGDFFTYYYHRVPAADFAQPPQSTTSTIGSAQVVKSNGKSYLVYNIDGLSDVYELQTGDSISATLKSGTAGTANPNSRPDGGGPFYSDPLRFSSKSSNTSFEYNVEWDFDNPEAGTENVVASRTPQEVVHQYTGLSTSTKVTSTKSVQVSVPGNPDMSDTVQVSMTLPKARVGIAGTTTLLDADGKTIDVVLGDEFMDSSDGTIEGHYAAWTIDGTTTNLIPNEKISVGGFGPHTAALSAKYGKYDGTFTTVGSPYVDTISAISYTVRPFIAAFAPATISGSQVTFKATSRTGSVTGLSSWNVEWTLKTPSGSDVVPPQSAPATFGTVTPFVVADRGAIPSGSILTLTVSVDPSLLDPTAANVASHTISQTLLTPDPKITRSGCENTGAPCSFTLSSNSSNSMDAWDIVWTLKRDGTTVGTSYSNPYTPSISSPGRYTISVVAKTDLFEGSATLTSWDAAGPICNDPPTSSQLAIYASCDNCVVNTNVTLKPDAFGYTWQDCEEYIWNFGDGSTLTTTDFTITHKYTSTGNKSIKLKVKKGTQTSPEVSYGIKIISGDTEPPPVTCAIPSNIQVSYSGNKGCGPNVACKTGEQVTFTARRLSSGLLACDNVTWTFHDNSTSTERSPRKTYTAANSYSVTAAVSNNLGNATPVTVTVQVVADSGGSCAAPPTADQVYVTYRGRTSGCNDGSPSVLCRANEIIDFSPGAFLGYSFQSCDRYEWDFGDSSAKSAEMDAAHTYTNPQASYRVKLRVYNQTNSTGTTFTVDVPFSDAPVKPLPVLSFAGFPTTGSKGNAVTFTVNSNIAATGWSWDFGDGKKDTQPTHIGTSSTITHVYENTGTYVVTVRARNADDVTSAPTNSATGSIKIDEIPEFRYLLPVAVHAPGQGGSVWRTDVQIYNPDPNVSASNKLDMTATFNGEQTQMHIEQSTYIYEDFLQRLTTADSAQGPVIISTKAKYAPQIWTRTYNQAENGTFGQFIPAIRLDAAGGGSAVGEGRYFLAGLRNDDRYRTNVGLVNPTALPLTATITAYDDAAQPILNGTFTRTINPYSLDQFPIGSVIQDFPKDRGFSLEIEVGTGQWVIAYASFIDGGSNDPIFLQAIRESELVSEDYRTVVIPGVGHTGAWRSDVEIYNSNGRGITVDLAYHDATGSKVGEATNVPIGGGEFLHFADMLKEGTLGGDVPDGLGMLRVMVPTSVSTERFPMAYARTYNDDGSGKTYGQGIAGFAAARPNVSATTTGLIPAVRSKAGEYYTNLFVTNVTDAPVMFSITVLDRTTGAQVRDPEVHEVGPYQTFAATNLDLGGESASLKIQATGNLWAYASVVDDRTKDPEYVPATPITP